MYDFRLWLRDTTCRIIARTHQHSATQALPSLNRHCSYRTPTGDGEVDMRTLGLTLLTVMFAAPCGGETVEWRAVDGGNGHGYEAVLAPQGISWTQARDAADALGGYLATITSAAENEFVYQQVADDPIL